jgi:Zn-dependent protease
VESALPGLESVIPLLGIGAADLRLAGIFVICMVLAISVHEFSHAYVAHKLGDPTPEGEGRLTLNPISHADPIGTLALPLIMALYMPGMLFGWGRPVPTQPRYYTRKVTMRGGMALVAFAGPLSNLAMAVLTGLIMLGLSTAGVPVGRDMNNPLVTFLVLNVVLFAFNLIPLHPLDGGKVLAWFLGAKHQRIDDFLMRYGSWILMGLIFLPPGRMLLGLLMAPLMSVASMILVAVT